MEAWLFENPWPLAGVLLAAASGVFVHWMRTGDPYLRPVSAGLAGLAGVVCLLAAAVQTEGEAVRAATRSLVADAVPGRVSAVAARLSPQVVVTGPEGGVWLDAGELHNALANRLPHWKVQSHHITMLDATRIRPGLIEAHLIAWTDFAPDARTDRVMTEWRLRWRAQADGSWRLEEARWEQLNFRPPPRGIWRR